MADESEERGTRDVRTTLAELVGLFVAAFVTTAGVLTLLDDELSGLALLTLACLGAIGATVAASEYRFWQRRSADKAAGRSQSGSASVFGWVRSIAGLMLVIAVVVGTATDWIDVDAMVGRTPAAIDSTDAETQRGREQRSNSRVESEAAVFASPNASGTERECPPLSDAALQEVSDSLQTDALRPNVQLSFIQETAIPSRPQQRRRLSGYTMLTYADSAWVITVLVDCDEQVVAYTLTTAKPDQFSPVPPRCVGTEEEGIASVRLPAFGRTPEAFYTLIAATIPSSYAQFRTIIGAEGCFGRAATAMVGSIVATGLLPSLDDEYSAGGYSVTSSHLDDETVSQLPGLPGGESLLRLTGDARPLPEAACARATSYGESSLRIDELDVLLEAGVLPSWSTVLEMTGQTIPESYGEQLCQ